jgi:N-acyl homoserine lactone hydrolase
LSVAAIPRKVEPSLQSRRISDKTLQFDILNPMFKTPSPVLMFAIGMAFSAVSMASGPELKLYVFDNGVLQGVNPADYHLTKEEAGETDMACASYLIVHTSGGRTETLLWDSGVIPDADIESGKSEAKRGGMTMKASKTLKSQLAAVGFAPQDITYFALSHYHFDHTANANAFAMSTWIVQQPERQAMFPDNAGLTAAAAPYAALKYAKTHLLHGDDFDVFGDGSVVVKAAYGHTPGHQVLVVKLTETGPVALVGDLYHFQAERGTDKVPVFEFSREQSLASRVAIEALVKQTGAQMWLEHDPANFRQLKKAPEFYK